MRFTFILGLTPILFFTLTLLNTSEAGCGTFNLSQDTEQFVKSISQSLHTSTLQNLNAPDNPPSLMSYPDLPTPPKPFFITLIAQPKFSPISQFLLAHACGTLHYQFKVESPPSILHFHPEDSLPQRDDIPYSIINFITQSIKHRHDAILFIGSATTCSDIEGAVAEGYADLAMEMWPLRYTPSHSPELSAYLILIH